MASIQFSLKRIVPIVVVLLLATSLGVWSHSVWKQRNEPGPWTIVLYHCDDEDVAEGSFIQNAEGNESLSLLIGPSEADSMQNSYDVRHSFFSRSIVGLSNQQCMATGEIKHPTGDLSIEFWMRFIDYGADIQIGLLEGVSLRIRIGGDGDRFQLMGANLTDPDRTDYCAPGFKSFPPVGNWHHYGVAIHAQNVEQLENANYRYGLGSYAQFFYDSHIVGFVGQTKLNISGLEFAPTVKPAILIHQGTMAFDEVMISNVDWSVPVGHGGSGHGGMSVGHAFEDGRQPVEIENWFLY